MSDFFLKILFLVRFGIFFYFQVWLDADWDQIWDEINVESVHT